jgi:hypothetical protein
MRVSKELQIVFAWFPITIVIILALTLLRLLDELEKKVKRIG